jgi:predicted DCC family thiol-disulfide oxidoreductase YuxK
VKNHWSAGHYAIFRALFGAYLFIHFLQLIPFATEVFSNAGALPDGSSSPLLYRFPNLLAVADSPEVVIGIVAAGATLSLFFAAGLLDRWAALGTWYIWASLLGRNPLISNPGIPYVGWMLLAHAFLPSARFGAWILRGRGGRDVPWRMPAAIFGVAWILLALGYSYSGLTKLLSPSWQDGTALLKMLSSALGRPGRTHDLVLAIPSWAMKAMTWGALLMELSFGPLAFVRRFRPWLWSLLFTMHLLLILLVDFTDLSLGMVMIHLFTFDPGWIRQRPASAPAVLYYDGQCGLCHRFVRFVLSEDAGGEAFRFAPLPEAGESLVVSTEAGVRLLRSEAVLYVLRRLGGLWRVMAGAGTLIPIRMRDGLYHCVARIRHSLFSRPKESCPLLPEGLRGRFAFERAK